MNCSMPGFPVIHYLPEFAQTHVHWVGDAIQPSHPLMPPFLLPSIFSSIRVFSNELALHIRWSEHWNFSFSISSVELLSHSASASVLSMNIQGWFPLVLTGLISLQSRGLLRVFASTTVWRHQFFGAQPSLWFNSHIHTWLHDYWKDRSFGYTDLCQQSDVFPS